MAWNQVGIYRAKGRKLEWLVRWYGEINPETGKPKRYSKSFRTRREAEDFKTTKAAEIRKSGRRDRPVNQGLGKLCQDFYRMKKASLKPASMDLYWRTINRLIDYFGADKSISDIGPKEADLFMAVQVYREDGKRKLSSWTRAQILTNCRAIFSAAVRWGQIATNPFKAVDKPRKVLKKWHARKPDEYLRLLEQAPDLRWKAFYGLAYTSGCRFGELFSLTWSNIDFEKAVVKIDNRAGTPTMPAFHVKDGEKREIPLPEHTVKILLDWHEQAPEGTPYILITPERYQRVLQRWRKLGIKDHLWENRFMVNNALRSLKVHLRRAEINLDGQFSIHTLRKSFAQNMANSGMPPRTLQYLLGHADIETTMKYYVQVDENAAALVRTATDRMIESAQRQQTVVRLEGNASVP